MEIRRNTPPLPPAVRAQSAARLVQLGEKLRKGETLSTTAAIPDLHANFIALHKIMSYLLGRQMERVFLGDYFDRLDGSRMVYQVLRREKNLLKGNHEMYVHLAMRGDLWGLTRWLSNGARPFIMECGIDLRQVDTAIDQLQKRYSFAGKGLEAILVQVQVDYPNILPELCAAIQANPVMREINGWLLERTKLYHLDDNGVLYIHGGVPADEARPGLLERLDDLGKRFEDLASAESPDLYQLTQVRKEINVFLSARGADFLAPIAREGDNAVSQYLRQMGVTGLVCAHTIKSSVGVTAGQVFEIDLGISAFNEASFVTFGQEGVKSFRESGPTGFQEEVLVAPADWRKQMLALI